MFAIFIHDINDKGGDNTDMVDMVDMEYKGGDNVGCVELEELFVVVVALNSV